MSGPSVTAVDPPLLTTKLHAPVRRRGMVERPRLTERFVTSDMPALTLVSAPAGFGKTTLVTEWVSGRNHGRRQTAWLSLDAGDNDPAMFWRYVVAALQTVAPGMGDDALSQLRASQPSTSVVTSLVNDLANLDDHLVLVLDDFHVIESAELHDAVASLLEHLPPQVHLVLAGRADPPLPLARMRARGELLEIRAADLRFSTDEATSYLNESMGLELTPADVDALESRTEGWVAALQLAALSMQGRADPGAFVAELRGRRPVRGRLPRRGGARAPARRGAELPARDLDPRPAQRCALRCGHRWHQRQDDARTARPGEPVPRPARRPAALVSLPPPVRRRPAGPTPRRRSRPRRRAAPTGERLVRSGGRPARGDRPCDGRARRRAGRPPHRAGRTGSVPDPPGMDRPALAQCRARRALHQTVLC